MNIGHDTSIRGRGISLNQALVEAGYLKFRKSFNALDLKNAIRAEPSFIEEWYSYSEDKRTSSGFFLANQAIHSMENLRKSRSIEDKSELIAEYIIQELDFWSGFNER